MRLSIAVPPGFNFLSTVYSHGWCSLAPFTVDKERSALRVACGFSSHERAIITVTQPSRTKLLINVDGLQRPGAAAKKEVKSVVNSCFRLEEDFSRFHRETGKLARFQWIRRKGAGRLLRAPTAFEDVVKMLCTTNCSWALTETMVKNLCRKLGSQVDDSWFTFPVPGAIADCSEKFLRKEIRAGYRSPYLLELARSVVRGNVDVESWRHSRLPTEELFDEVQSVKGIGPYAAGNILKLLGRYDYLGIDSWSRKKFSEIHRNGRSIGDKVIEKFYEPFGKWRGLFFWMDLTREWYEREFPF